MNDLLKKLNTLVSATVHEVAPSLPRLERTPDLDRQVRELRERINAALEHEDKLQGAARDLRDEVARLDSLVDAAVAQGREADARYLLEQMKRAEQRLSFAEADLRAHQRAAEELIRNVNNLEAAVADKKHGEQQSRQGSTPAASTTPTSPREPARHEPATEEPYRNPAEAYAKPVREAGEQQVAASESAVERISGMIRDAQDRTRERIAMLGELLTSADATQGTIPAARPTPQPAAGEQPGTAAPPTGEMSNIMPRPKPPAKPEPKPDDDDDDLAQRLRRLSKPE